MMGNVPSAAGLLAAAPCSRQKRTASGSPATRLSCSGVWPEAVGPLKSPPPASGQTPLQLSLVAGDPDA
eukprot:3311213-Prymnesium_polylepis.1